MLQDNNSFTFRHLSIGAVYAKRLQKDGWNFDWSEVPSTDTAIETVGLFLNDELQGLVQYTEEIQQLYNVIYIIESAPQNRGRDKKIEGVAGRLFAYVARDSLDAGLDGFVLFRSKSALFEHYIEKYGAQPVPNRDRYLYFDTNASLKLISDYLGYEYKEVK